MPRNLRRKPNPNPEASQTRSRTKAPRERGTQSLTNASHTHNITKHQHNQGPLSSSTPRASESSLFHLSLPKRSRCTRSDSSDAPPSRTGTALPPCVLKLRRRNLKGVYSKLFTDSKTCDRELSGFSWLCWLLGLPVSEGSPGLSEASRLLLGASTHQPPSSHCRPSETQRLTKLDPLLSSECVSCSFCCRCGVIP